MDFYVNDLAEWILSVSMLGLGPGHCMTQWVGRLGSDRSSWLLLLYLMVIFERLLLWNERLLWMLEREGLFGMGYYRRAGQWETVMVLF